jgi:hypothetical protein
MAFRNGKRVADAPPADWSLWSQMPTANLWQAVALSLGFEPGDQWPRNDREALRFSAEYVRRFKIAEASVASGALRLSGGLALTPGATIALGMFAGWAANLGWTLPQELKVRIQADRPAPPQGELPAPSSPANYSSVYEDESRDWRERARARASEWWLECDASTKPNPNMAAAFVARWCRDHGVRSQVDSFSDADYLRKHILDKKHWTPPTR